MRLKTSRPSGKLSRYVTFLLSTSQTPRSPSPPTAPFSPPFCRHHCPWEKFSQLWSASMWFSKSQLAKKSL